MIAEHFERHALLCHRNNRLLVHVGVVNAHSAEYRKSLHKILVVLGEELRKQQVIKGHYVDDDGCSLTKSSNLLIN